MTGTRWAVLDVETALSDDAMLLLPPGPRPTIERIALQRLTAGALLLFEEDGAGLFSGFELVSGEGDDEAGLLSLLAGPLRAVHNAGGRLATFNGGHDVSVLRRRSQRHWMFGSFELRDWLVAGCGTHDDLMLLNQFGHGRRPSLIDACAGLGVPAAVEPPSSRDAVRSEPLRKCQLDVVLTAVLLFHHLSSLDGTPLKLMRGWTAMSDGLGTVRPGLRHLGRVLRHPSVTEARAFLERHGEALGVLQERGDAGRRGG